MWLASGTRKIIKAQLYLKKIQDCFFGPQVSTATPPYASYPHG